MNTADFDNIKHGIDAVAISSLVATLFGYLPAATAFLTFIWVVIRLYETATVQRWFYGKK